MLLALGVLASVAGGALWTANQRALIPSTAELERRNTATREDTAEAETEAWQDPDLVELAQRQAESVRPVIALPEHQTGDTYFLDGIAELRRARALPWRGERARNVIIFIGDGMDLSTVTAARIFDGQSRGFSGEEGRLAWEDMPHVALTRTYNTNQQVPDSAGTATAIFTGVKTMAGVLGVSPDVRRGSCRSAQGNQLISLFALAEQAGLSTGIVTTTRLTHATPAAAYASIPERDWESDADIPSRQRKAGCKDIAAQLVDFPWGDGIDVALGGGWRAFLPTPPAGSAPAADDADEHDADDDGAADAPVARHGERGDGRDLPALWLARAPHAALVWDARELAHIKARKVDRLLGLFASSHMDFSVDARIQANQPSLEEMTIKALEVLESRGAGWVLLVEGGRIDHAHHMSNAWRALDETVELSKAVRAARRMVDPEQTLVLVTADHGHTMTISGYPVRGNPILGKVFGNDDAGDPEGRPSLATDGKPFTALSYANGPGAVPDNERRPDLTDIDTTRREFVQQSLLGIEDEVAPGHKMVVETHGGQDVPVWAAGPSAHLLQGSVEQSYLFHLMANALGIAQ